MQLSSLLISTLCLMPAHLNLRQQIAPALLSTGVIVVLAIVFGILPLQQHLMMLTKAQNEHA